jgi:hypothetical protein
LPPASAGGLWGLNFRGFSALERGFSMQALAIFGSGVRCTQCHAKKTVPARKRACLALAIVTLDAFIKIVMTNRATPPSFSDPIGDGVRSSAIQGPKA